MAKIFIRVKEFDTEKHKKEERTGKPHCRCCGSHLKDPESIARGYGPQCYKSRTAAVILRIVPDSAGY